jgi:hypothetical protein
MEPETIKVGPFTWKRKDHDEDECWVLVQPENFPTTHWCLKDYGGEPQPGGGFNGWRLVSGGPFSAAGGWRSRDGAMLGVVPWLVNYYRTQLRYEIEKAKRMADAMEKVLKDLP